MSTVWSRIAMIVLAAGLVVLLGCGKSGQKEEAGTGQEVKKEKTAVKDQMKMMGSEKLAYVENAEKLYTCSEHPSYVTDDPSAVCNLCNEPVVEMSMEEMLKLRASDPKGCPMCRHVVPGNSEMEKCPRCEMAFVPVKQQPATGEGTSAAKKIREESEEM